MVAPDNPTDSATGVFVPGGVDGGKLVKSLRDDFGVTLAGEQDQWKGKVVRIAHLGYVNTLHKSSLVKELPPHKKYY